MCRALCLLLLAVAIAGCGSSSAAGPQPTPTASRATPTPRITNATPSTGAVPTSTPVHPSAGYIAFLATLCRAFAQHDANTVSNLLPRYQYNSGVRYGALGDGEGSTGDPGILSTWLAQSHVRCVLDTPDIAGHGTLLAGGWVGTPGPWALIEADVYNGSNWRINDFTFGNRGALYAAMQTSHPILPYHG